MNRIENKRARYDYKLGESYTCGVVLSGVEVKACKSGNASLDGAYCTVSDDIDAVGIQIMGASRALRLLLKRTEIRDIRKDTQVKGRTLVVTGMFANKRGLIKITVAVASGKNASDKRQAIKARDAEREIASR